VATGGLGRDQESRDAPRDSTSTRHRSRIPFLISKVGRGRNESGTMHRAALMCTSSRFTSTFPRSGPIHASGFPAASRLVTIPIVLRGPVPAADSIASIHPLREALVQREKTAHSREGEQARSIASSRSPHVVGQNIRRLPNDVLEFIPPSRPSPFGEGEQRAGRVDMRRTSTHPCLIPRLFSNSPSSLLGRGQALATPHRNGQLDHRSRRRPPCRRCGQSHWPQPPACPDRDVRGQWLA
jgi:hypothetical protein